MSLKPMDFFLLIASAIRDRELERELDAEVERSLVQRGYLNSDNSLNVEVMLAHSRPLNWSEYGELRDDA